MNEKEQREAELWEYIYYAVRSHNGSYADEDKKKACIELLDSLK